MSKRKRKKSQNRIQADIQKAVIRLLQKSYTNGDPTFFVPSYQKNGDSEQAVKKPYANNVWVYSAVTGIVNNLLQLPKILVDTGGKEDEVITEHPILSLLESPNSLMDGPTFWENIILDLMLNTPSTKGGQCFLLCEAVNGGAVNLEKGEIPGEIYPFTDEHITPIVEKDTNLLMGWKFKPGNSDKAIIYKPEELIRIYLVDPDSPVKGQAPIYATRDTLSQEAKAVALNKNFFDNNAVLGGILSTEAELEKEVATEIRDSFESTHAGQENAGRIPVLHSGLKYQQITKSHGDMQFLEQRKYGREEILAAYRVPKFVVSVYEDLNFATSKEAEKAFWKQTCIPLDNRILRPFNSQWIQYVDKKTLVLKSDHSKVPALQPDFTELLEQAAKLFKLQVPVEEINRRLDLGLEVDQYSWLKTWLTNFNQVPAEDVVEGDFNEVEETEEDDKEKSADNLIQKIEKIAQQKASDDKLITSYTQGVLIPDEKRFKKMLTKYFKEQRNKILDAVDSWANSQKAAPNPTDLLPKKVEENKRLQKNSKPYYEDFAKTEGEIVEEELGELVEWQLNSPRMRKIIARRLNQIKIINTTTFRMARNHISEAVKQAVDEGLGLKETAKLIKKEVNKVYAGRIKTQTIARTEVASIHGQTRFDVYETEGITKIRWLTEGDDDVRGKEFTVKYPHNTLDQEETKIGEAFNNGEQIRFPHDPSASPGNTINCRCIIRSVKEK